MTVSVSVVIPARNEEGYIASALASVAAQRYPLSDIECVVVDNGSVDQTAGAALSFANECRQLSVRVVREHETGVARAKNRGARAARGQILVFLDADSRLEASLIQDVVGEYEAGNPAGSIRIVADSDDRLERGFFGLMEVGKVLFGVRAQMMYCERTLFLELDGFLPELRHAEDLEFLQRVRKHVAEAGRGKVCHVRTSTIATSPRRLQGGRFRRNLMVTFARWLLAFAGWGREREY
ncbi:MAG: glycosyltransferase [Chloroflexota bacterium]|nr:MAG: glycosyltransferase [Chloroflexota bacterium]